MKWMKKLAAGVSALALCASMTASAIGTALPAAAADTNNDDWLHAVGSRLYDSEGNEVWLTGANWFGLNCSVAHGRQQQWPKIGRLDDGRRRVQ